MADELRPFDDHGLAGYTTTLSVYAATTMAGWQLVRRSGGPRRIGAGDLVGLVLATNKLSRLIARDPVTRPVRAAFTEPVGVGGPAELVEEPRGTGLRRTVGELVSCPFCVGQWVATAGVIGMHLQPELTRTACTVLSVSWASDILQFGRAWLVRRAEG